MAQIPLHLPQQIPPSFNVRGDHPSPQAKGAMAANLGVSAMSVVSELSHKFTMDRQRRDYNEALLSAQKTLNSENEKALLSNDPRTMLDKFNDSIEREYGTIRDKIPNIRDRKQFDYQTLPGLTATRMNILKTQIKYERQESSAQRIAQLEEMQRTLAVNDSPEMLLDIRDQIDAMTTESVMTGDMTPQQAQNWNLEAAGALETWIVSNMVENGRYREARARLSSGEFASISPVRVTALNKSILGEEQNHNYVDGHTTLIHGEAGDTFGQSLEALRDSKGLSQPQFEKLWGMWSANHAKKMVNDVSDKMIQTAYDGGLSWLDPDNPDDKKAATGWAERRADPVFAESIKAMALQAEQEAEETGQKSDFNAEETLMGLRFEALSRIGYVTPKHWLADAFRITANIGTNPLASIAAAKYIRSVAQASPEIMAYEESSGTTAGLGRNGFNRALEITRLADLQIKPNEIVRMVKDAEFRAEHATEEIMVKEYDSFVELYPNHVTEGMRNYVMNDSTRYSALGDKTIGGFITAYGTYPGDTPENAQSVMEGVFNWTAGIASEGFLDLEDIPFVGGPLGVARDFVGDVAETSAAIGTFGIVGDNQFKTLMGPGEGVLQDDEGQVEGEPGAGPNQIAIEPDSISSRFMNFFNDGAGRIDFPESMQGDIGFLFEKRFKQNGGSAPEAINWAITMAIGSGWLPTRFHGPVRFEKNGVEVTEPKVNGSHEYTRELLVMDMNESLGDYVAPYDTVGGIFPKWTGLDNVDEYLGDVFRVLTWRALDNPNHPFTDKTYSGKAAEIGRRTLNTLMQFGDIREFPFNIYHKYATAGDRGIRQLTTREPQLREVTLSDGSKAMKNIYYLSLTGRYGAELPLWGLPGNNSHRKEFFYDHTASPVYRQAKRDKRQTQANAIVERVMKLATRTGMSEQKSIEMARQQLNAAKFEDTEITTGMSLVSGGDADANMRSAAQGRWFKGDSLSTPAPRPIMNANVPDYDREADLEARRREGMTPQQLERERIGRLMNEQAEADRASGFVADHTPSTVPRGRP